MNVSVVLPCHNRAGSLSSAVESVLNQTYKDFELIVVDDGSTDATTEVLLKFRDERLRVIRLEHQRGACAARNAGIRSSTAPFIAFQDSDDEWLPNKLERQVAVANEMGEEYGVVYTTFWLIQGDKCEQVPRRKLDEKEGHVLRPLLRGNFVSTQTIFVRRSCLDVCGLFDESLPRLQDWELCLRLAERYQFKLLREPYVRVYRSPKSISRDQNKLVEAYQLILKKHYRLFSADKRVMATLYYKLGTSLLAINERELAKPFLLKALRHDPLKECYLFSVLSLACGLPAYRIFASFENWVARISGK